MNEEVKDAKQKPKSASEEVIEQTDDTTDDLLLKRPDDLTEEKIRELIRLEK